MRPLSRMFSAVSSLSILGAIGCADQLQPTAPVDATELTLAAVTVTGSPTAQVEAYVGDTVRVLTGVKTSPTWTPRDKNVLKVLTTYDGRMLALAPGRTYVMVWTKPWNGSAYRDSTLVIVRDRSTSPTAPAPTAPAPTEPAPADTTPVTSTGTLVTGAYYVSTTGSDANPGTQGQPWRTLGKSLSRLRAGQTLYVRGGTYTENIQNPAIQQGTATARITVAAYPGERPVLVGLLWLTRPSHWTFDGINVTWKAGNPSTSHMVKLTNGIGWTYQNSEVWGAHSFANMLVYGSVRGEPSNWTIRNNCIHDTYASNRKSQDQNLYVNTGITAGPGLIERNVFFNAPNGMNVKLGYGRSDPQAGDGTANVTVRFNTMYSALKNMMVTDEGHDNLVERNIMVGSAENYAVRSYRLSGTNNVFRNNIVNNVSKLEYADPGYRGVTDGGGNRLPYDPKMSAPGCSGLRPADAAAQGFGHLAP